MARYIDFEVAWVYGEMKYCPLTHELTGPDQEEIARNYLGFTEAEKEILLQEGAEGFYWDKELDI